MSSVSVSIVGATGLVGTTVLALLEHSPFPIKEVHVVASQQSSGKTIKFKHHQLILENLAEFDFSKCQISFFCVSNELSKEYAPKAVAAGNVVIDKSNAFRTHESVPLIVPEVNLDALSQYKKMGIIANPNCNTIPIAVGLKPIYDAVGIRRINVCTYQSVSGTGKEAVSELTEQTKSLLAHHPFTPKVYPQQIAFNVLPHIDDFDENGYTREELKIVNEMRKIFNDATLAINPTAVRVPVYCGHAASVHIETDKKITTSEAEQLLSKAPGIKLMTGKYPYPTPARDAAGNDLVYVGRVREDISHPKGLNLWIVADNLRKGAALNAIQIADHFIKQYMTL